MRVAVLSDIHGNLVALDAVLADLGTVDAIWHLGDVVGYGPDPNGVVQRLEAIGAIGVRGNHDAAATGGDEIDWFNPEAKAAMEWTRRTISASTRSWLADLPDRLVEADFTLTHGSPRDPIWEYITTTAVARANLAVLTTTYGLYGHTHHPMAWRDDGERLDSIAPAHGSVLGLDGRRALINPGSVGGTATAGHRGWPSTPTRRRSPGDVSPTTSVPSRPRCGQRTSRVASSTGSRSASDTILHGSATGGTSAARLAARLHAVPGAAVVS
jgi:predicted phosphodiesterase